VLTEARALAFERRELWDQAVAQYRAVLATDANLLFAQNGLERSEARAGLDASSPIIDNPTLLFGDTVLADKLLGEAAAQTDKGRVSRQIDNGRILDSPRHRFPSDQLLKYVVSRRCAQVFADKQVE
jgi:ketopantoate reductase